MNRRRTTPSLPGLTRQSILLRKKMDARVKPAHDGVKFLRRREFITLLGGAAAAPSFLWSRAARAQQPAMPLIGVLSPVSAAIAVRNIAAFRQALRDLGYVEGRNIAIEYRFAEGISERLTRLTAELVGLNPSVIVVGSMSGIVSASKVTRTAPLIMIGGTEDPVRLGLAENV